MTIWIYGKLEIVLYVEVERSFECLLSTKISETCGPVGKSTER